MHTGGMRARERLGLRRAALSLHMRQMMNGQKKMNVAREHRSLFLFPQKKVEEFPQI